MSFSFNNWTNIHRLVFCVEVTQLKLRNKQLMLGYFWIRPINKYTLGKKNRSKRRYKKSHLAGGQEHELTWYSLERARLSLFHLRSNCPCTVDCGRKWLHSAGKQHQFASVMQSSVITWNVRCFIYTLAGVSNGKLKCKSSVAPDGIWCRNTASENNGKTWNHTEQVSRSLNSNERYCNKATARKD